VGNWLDWQLRGAGDGDGWAVTAYKLLTQGGEGDAFLGDRPRYVVRAAEIVAESQMDHPVGRGKSHRRAATLRGVQTRDISHSIEAALQGRRLLDHPYYRAWQEGVLTCDDLARYAEQYRHFEQTLPAVLADVAELIPEGVPRQLVESNLEDELSRPRPHIDMFESFAGEVGAVQGVAPTEATQTLVNLYRDGVRRGSVPALAVIAAYESQAAGIAATKASALSQHYDVNLAGTDFWTVHATAEERHAAWTVEALTLLQADADTVQYWANCSVMRWWEFLDERDTDRAA
jgi:pyrroloquinoline quinone (PQQ) biosynthesis protein C